MVAPGDGIVVDENDCVYDNISGNRNARDIPGNYVIIDHLNSEFSMLAHFKKGSILVVKDEQVSAGDPIGQCGNSGHSNLPHFHYHLHNTPNWLDGEEPLKAFCSFKDRKGNLLGEVMGYKILNMFFNCTFACEKTVPKSWLRK